MERRSRIKSALRKSSELSDQNEQNKIMARNFIENIGKPEGNLAIQQKHLTQCVFLGALRLKPVPDIFQVTLQPLAFGAQSTSTSYDLSYKSRINVMNNSKNIGFSEYYGDEKESTSMNECFNTHYQGDSVSNCFIRKKVFSNKIKLLNNMASINKKNRNFESNIQTNEVLKNNGISKIRNNSISDEVLSFSLASTNKNFRINPEVIKTWSNRYKYTREYSSETEKKFTSNSKDSPNGLLWNMHMYTQGKLLNDIYQGHLNHNQKRNIDNTVDLNEEDEIEDYLEIDQNIVEDLEALIPEEEIQVVSNTLNEHIKPENPLYAKDSCDSDVEHSESVNSIQIDDINDRILLIDVSEQGLCNSSNKKMLKQEKAVEKYHEIVFEEDGTLRKPIPLKQSNRCKTESFDIRCTREMLKKTVSSININKLKTRINENRQFNIMVKEKDVKACEKNLSISDISTSEIKMKNGTYLLTTPADEECLTLSNYAKSDEISITIPVQNEIESEEVMTIPLIISGTILNGEEHSDVEKKYIRHKNEGEIIQENKLESYEDFQAEAVNKGKSKLDNLFEGDVHQEKPELMISKCRGRKLKKKNESIITRKTRSSKKEIQLPQFSDNFSECNLSEYKYSPFRLNARTHLKKSFRAAKGNSLKNNSSKRSIARLSEQTKHFIDGSKNNFRDLNQKTKSNQHDSNFETNEIQKDKTYKFNCKKNGKCIGSVEDGVTSILDLKLKRKSDCKVQVKVNKKDIQMICSKKEQQRSTSIKFDITTETNHKIDDIKTTYQAKQNRDYNHVKLNLKINDATTDIPNKNNFTNNQLSQSSPILKPTTNSVITQGNLADFQQVDVMLEKKRNHEMTETRNNEYTNSECELQKIINRHNFLESIKFTKKLTENNDEISQDNNMKIKQNCKIRQTRSTPKNMNSANVNSNNEDILPVEFSERPSILLGRASTIAIMPNKCCKRKSQKSHKKHRSKIFHSIEMPPDTIDQAKIFNDPCFNENFESMKSEPFNTDSMEFVENKKKLMGDLLQSLVASDVPQQDRYKRIYRCRVCVKVFKNYEKLKEHKQEHEVKNPYQCQQCENSYDAIEELAAHLRIHKGKMPYPCRKCDASFWTADSLESHRLVHILKKVSSSNTSSNKRVFRCDVCNKEFKKICDLERHTRVHTGEKPSVCNICNKRFQQAYNLNKHLLTHTQEKNFECDICQKRFGRNDILNRHVLTHSLDKPFHCTICSKTFIRKTQLELHSRKYHGPKDETRNGKVGMVILTAVSSG